MKKYFKSFFSISLCLVFYSSFGQETADTVKANRDALATLNNYLVAVKEHDVSKTLSYFSNTNDFLVYANDKAMNYEEFTTGIKTTFSQIKSLDLRFDNIYIRNINENAVWITGSFHQSVADVNNRQFDYNGTASLILLKRDGEWKITYVAQVVR
jgi:ketosteroid isomerase-like protein